MLILFKDNLNYESGLVVRINKNTFLPEEDNPFYLKILFLIKIMSLRVDLKIYLVF